MKFDLTYNFVFTNSLSSAAKWTFRLASRSNLEKALSTNPGKVVTGGTGTNFVDKPRMVAAAGGTDLPLVRS